MDKIRTREQALSALGPYGSRRSRVALTNGCFDVIHVGHVRYLEAARRLGDCLVVGLNSDESVRRLKGPRRPVFPQHERAEMLAALECVDIVILFDENTAERLVEFLRPDVYVKGADYAAESGRELPEAEIVRSYGGEVELIPLVEDRSTTAIIERMLAEKEVA